MKLKIAYILIASLLLITCQKGQESEASIPKEKFVKILVDMHLADGMITAGGLNKKKGKEATTSLYNHVFKKHSVTRHDFEQTVAFYCQHPEQYKEVYSKVIQSLKAMKKKEDGKPKKKKKDKNDIWKKKTSWKMPKDGKRATIPFSIRRKEQGIYTLSADYKIYPDDKSLHPIMSIMVRYKDGTKEVKENGALANNGKKQNHEVFIITNPKKKIERITGWLYKHSIGSKSKYADITNVKLIYKKIKKK